MPDLESLTGIVRICAAVGCLLAVAWVGGVAAVKMGQPSVIGELTAGFVLGPTAFGGLWPGVLAATLAPPTDRLIHGLAQLGLWLFLFACAQECRRVAPEGSSMRAALVVAFGSTALPLLAGAAVAVPLYGGFAGERASPIVFAVFVGCCLAVTAVPVLARITGSRAELPSEVAALCLAAAAIGDGVCWLVFSTLPTAGRQGAGVVAVAVVSCSLWVVMWFVRRTWPDWWGGMRRRVLTWGATRPAHWQALGAVIAACAGQVTSALGLHALLGIFAVGVLWPVVGARRACPGPVDRLAAWLVPLYFVSFGLQLDLSAVPLTATVGCVLAVVMALAVTTKFAGCAIACRAVGMSGRDAVVGGILMNTRGVTELVLLGVGYSEGLINTPMLAVLTFIAVVTTIGTAPLLGLMQRWFAPARPTGSPTTGVVGARRARPEPEEDARVAA